MRVSPYEIYRFQYVTGSGKISVYPWKHRIFITSFLSNLFLLLQNNFQKLEIT